MEYSWLLKNIMNSWDMFWASSLACFLLGAYAIVGSIYVYNAESDIKYKQA